MWERRARSRVLGSRSEIFRSLLTIPSTICVTSCSRIGTSLLLEIQRRIVDLTGFQDSPDYKVSMANGVPSYRALWGQGLLESRVAELEKLLERCTVCPRDCLNNRLNNEIAACYSGRLPIVSSYTAHFGEEPPLVGTKGAGNVFFGNCNLRCVYCQNYQISQRHKEQLRNEVTHERLAEMMLELQAKGCHNINFVSPTHFAPQMARGILLAAQAGLKLPIVYNTNAYDSVEVLRLLEGIVGVYLPEIG